MTADRTIAIGYLLLGGALMWILLMGESKKVKIEVVPQGDSEEDEKVSRLDFRKRVAG